MEAQSGKDARSDRWITILAGLFAAILLGNVLLPYVDNWWVRRRVPTTLESINNVKNLTLALHNYANGDSGQLPRTVNDPAPQSWRTQILQFVDRSDLQRAYQADQAWDVGTNAELARIPLKVFDSPSGRRGMNPGQEWAPADYGMISGPGTVQPGNRAVTLDEITAGDGLASTLILGECVGLKLAWAEPRDPHTEREQIGIERVGRDQKSTYLLSTSSSAPAVAFADGAARMLNPKIDLKVLKALCTIDGDEPINQEDYLR